MKILVTGFAPFGGDTVNASWEAVSLLPARLGKAELARLLLPVEYDTAGQLAVAEAERIHADMILCTGVAGGRTAVTPELIAVNWRMADIADNAGVRHDGVLVRPGKPAALMTSFPIVPMSRQVSEAGVPCRVSLTAGAYVCNDVYWHILEAEQRTGCRALFVHVPALAQLEASQSAKALTILLEQMIAFRASAD